MHFYAVARGKIVGIFTNWNDCSDSVKGFKNAKYKKFSDEQEAKCFVLENSVIHSDTKDTENIDMTVDYYVYTDGACSNNGRSNALAGIGIYFGENDVRNISKKIDGKQTNNTAELTAIIETYHKIKSDIDAEKCICIVSDSEYAIKCVTTYGEKCFKKNWQLDIPNKELVKTAYELYNEEKKIKFMHIKAHTNNADNHSIGNKHADRLANYAIGLEVCPYASELYSS